MSAVWINNAIQIYFDSVFGMADAEMVQMFKALESSELRGFLGCSSTIYEAALVEFFHNASVRDDKVVIAVQGKSIEISEELFAGTFELPTEGLTDMHDMPKDLVFDARSAFSTDVQQFKTSFKKREMKFEFRLLNDILAKTVTVKAGSFDAVTHERFLMMSTIHGGVKGTPDLDLGESKEFLPLKILTAKTVGTYVAKNKNITIEEVVDEPMEKVVKNKAVTKRTPAPTADEPVAKKKRTIVGRAAPAKQNLAMVTVAQYVEPISVIKETTEIAEEETDFKEPVVVETAGTDPVTTEIRIDVSAITNEEEEHLFETECENEKEKEKEIEPVADKGMSLEKIIESEDTGPLSKVLELTATSSTYDEESLSIDDLLAQIPEDMMLPSTIAAEPTRIKFGLGIEIKGVQ
ncbi:hypothetical protein F511_16600 [Dorcoceras hygrometricum]|uniref:Splicing factor 3B subunit 1-like n=1 Tax=Dorcoceras hygrometricum TaxID=472368 RepID=A0A2Z7CHC5_9LAMI|nr:hypothetical protein F511_16600 [Dorcoceras hygrometricum]